MKRRFKMRVGDVARDDCWAVSVGDMACAAHAAAVAAAAAAAVTGFLDACLRAGVDLPERLAAAAVHLDIAAIAATATTATSPPLLALASSTSTSTSTCAVTPAASAAAAAATAALPPVALPASSSSSSTSLHDLVRTAHSLQRVMLAAGLAVEAGAYTRPLFIST